MTTELADLPAWKARILKLCWDGFPPEFQRETALFFIERDLAASRTSLTRPAAPVDLSLGERLDEDRRKNHLSVEEQAELIGIYRSLLYRIRQDRAGPRGCQLAVDYLKARQDPIRAEKLRGHLKKLREPRHSKLFLRKMERAQRLSSRLMSLAK